MCMHTHTHSLSLSLSHMHTSWWGSCRLFGGHNDAEIASSVLPVCPSPHPPTPNTLKTYLNGGHVDFFRSLYVVPDAKVAPVLRHHHVTAWHPLYVGAVVQHTRLLPALNVKQVQLHKDTHWRCWCIKLRREHNFSYKQWTCFKIQRFISTHFPLAWPWDLHTCRRLKAFNWPRHLNNVCQT